MNIDDDIYTVDGVYTIQKQIKDMELKDKELEKQFEENVERIYKREMIQRVKCLSLLKMNKSIFTNTSSMKIKERELLQKIMHEYNDIDHQIIINEFNEKIGDILDDENFEPSNVPIYEFK